MTRPTRFEHHQYVGDKRTQIVQYAGASGDYNPLHVDLEVAAASEFGGTIAHGPIAFQALFRSLTDGLGSPALPPGTRIAVTSPAPVRPGDAVSSQLEPIEGQPDHDYAAACVNQDGTTVISGTLSLPS